jgi:hypothetical protein
VATVRADIPRKGQPVDPAGERLDLLVANERSDLRLVRPCLAGLQVEQLLAALGIPRPASRFVLGSMASA